MVTMLLSLFDTVYAMCQMVCFSGKLTEMPSKNSAIRAHHGNRSGGIYAKVYSNNSLFIYRCIANRNLFLEREV